MNKFALSRVEMNWYLITLEKIGDPFGLMMIEVQGKNEAEAKARLVSVIYAQACHIKACEEV